MASARITPTGTRLQAVRDEDVSREPDTCSVCHETSWRSMRAGICDGCRVPYPAHPAAEQVTFRGEIFVPIPTPPRAHQPRRKRCASGSSLKVRPTQLALAFDRPRALQTLKRLKGYSLGTGKLTTAEKEDSKRLRPFMLRQVPKTRGECIGGPRPCPVIRCSHHLYVTVNPDNGSIKLNFPGKLIEELEYTCSLDAADEHHETGMTLEKVGELCGLSLERVRQVEADALGKLKTRLNPEAISALLTGKVD